MYLRTILLGFAIAISSAAPAKNFRWAAQADASSMDPHATNELFTGAINNLSYEGLTRYDEKLVLAPALATSWKNTTPTTWLVMLRKGVKWQDGSDFTADDVVFTFERAKQSGSTFRLYSNQIGVPRKIDAHTVEFVTPVPNPVLPIGLVTIFIMNKAWCEQHKVQRPIDLKKNEESYASFNANGTGPFVLTGRQPNARTSFKRHVAWWGEAAGQRSGNVQGIVFSPIANDATRLAALVSGELDFVLDPAPRDVPRLRNTTGVKVVEGPENRIIFIGMDQHRDELVYGSVKTKNPFKDLRVRQALYHAIDIQTIKTKLMNGLSLPTGSVMPSLLAQFSDMQYETRLPYDVARARALMAEAGYADGFEVTLDCPNNRYINDEAICTALAAMWSQLKVKIKVNAQPRALWFPKMEKFDTSMYLLGWGGAVTDAETTFTPVLRTLGERGVGLYNWGRVRNDKFDALAAASSVEPDASKREQLIRAALAEYLAQSHVLPLHRQVIPWAMRSNVELAHRADNWLEVTWVTLR